MLDSLLNEAEGRRGKLAMTPDTIPGITLVIRVWISVIPLTVQIVGHAYDVINHGSNPIDRKCLEILEREGGFTLGFGAGWMRSTKEVGSMCI